MAWIRLQKPNISRGYMGEVQDTRNSSSIYIYLLGPKRKRAGGLLLPLSDGQGHAAASGDGGDDGSGSERGGRG